MGWKVNPNAKPPYDLDASTFLLRANGDIIVKMGEQSTNKKFCAIASIEIGDDNSLEVQKLVTFHGGHSDCDRRYGWGFNYAPGSKD